MHTHIQINGFKDFPAIYINNHNFLWCNVMRTLFSFFNLKISCVYHVCTCIVCVQACACHCTLMEASSSLRFPSWACREFEAGSLCCLTLLCICQAIWLLSFWGLSVSTSHFVEALGLQLWTTMLDFTWFLGIWTPVILTWQVLCLLVHLPSLCFFKTRSCYVTLAVLERTMYPRLPSNLWRSFCFCFPNAEITGMCYLAWLPVLNELKFLKYNFNIIPEYYFANY